MKTAAIALLAASVLMAADGPSLYYSKSFPKSVPEYVQVNLDRSGAVQYREAVDDDMPVKFQLKDAEAAEIFGLADKLGHFQQPLESPAKVAFMGTKIFRWVNGGETHEVKFNYSQDTTAQALLDWFERISESAQREIDLERTVKYDKLGVVQSLIAIQIAMDKKRLVGAEQYLPMLDRVIKNESYMHTAREQAAQIADAIRNPKP